MSNIGFYPGRLEERLTGGTQRTTGLMVRYEVVKVSISRKDLYVKVATLKFIRLCIGSQWRLERSRDVGTERGERVIVLVIVLSVIPNGWYHTQGRLGTRAEATKDRERRQ